MKFNLVLKERKKIPFLSTKILAGTIFANRQI